MAEPNQHQVTQNRPGDVWADLDSLYAAEMPVVYGFLSRAGARQADLEDLVHDVFVTAMRRWPSYDRARPLRPWLLGIAHHTLVDFRRTAGEAQRDVREVPDLPEERNRAEESLAARDARALVQEALQSLDEERRSVFIMCELEEVPVIEAAEAMGAKVATTYSRLRVAREEFTAAVRRIQLRRGER